MSREKMVLRRRNMVVVNEGSLAGNAQLGIGYIGAILKDVEQFGYTFDGELIERVRTLSATEVVEFHKSLISMLKESVGAHVRYRPMYPGFPRQVMEASDAQLFVDAVLHFLSIGTGMMLPDYTEEELEARFPLIYSGKAKVLHLAKEGVEKEILANLLASKTSLSETDKEDLKWFVGDKQEEVLQYLPDVMPLKENVGFVCGLLLKHVEGAEAVIRKYFKTSTDVLRFAVALSDGDISLATNTRFRKFSRKERRFLLSLLENSGNIEEDMLRFKGPWVRMGERLHPGEYSVRFPKTAEAFRKLRNDIKIETFNGKVEKGFSDENYRAVVELLKSRPGNFARNLDRLLRADINPTPVLNAFASVAHEVSSPVLLQVREHFKERNNPRDLRVFLPKGNLAKAYGLENNLQEIDENTCERVVIICEEALKKIYGEREDMGKVFIDPALADYLVPFSQRSASRSYQTIVRGSKLPIDETTNTVRAFIYWKECPGVCADIDLSATLLDEKLNKLCDIAYYNLRDEGFNAYHSGDVRTAPNGASEFLDVDLDSFAQRGGRYIVFTINMFSQQPFAELPECFFGWMNRECPNSGEIYEPKTVIGKADITSDSTVAIPLILDVVERKAIWCDLSLKAYPNFPNNTLSNLKGITLMVKSILDMVKPNLYDLLVLNAQARGELVESREQADIIFSVDEGVTPYNTDVIMGQYL